MKGLILHAITALAFVAIGCSKRVKDEANQRSPMIQVETGKFYLHYANRNIVDLNEIDSVTKACKPHCLDIFYGPGSTTSDLMMTLTHFGGLGIGDYNLAATSDERFPFFLPGYDDCGVLDKIANAPHSTYLLEEVLSDRSITIERFAHIMFPEHSVSLPDFATCLQRCVPAGCVFLDGIEDGFLYTGRFEDWMSHK